MQSLIYKATDFNYVNGLPRAKRTPSTKQYAEQLTQLFSVLQQSLAAQVAFRKPLAECLDDVIKQDFQVKAKGEINIIDAGAGTGLMAVELQKLGYTNLHALDISQEMLNEAKKKNLYKKIICAPLNDQRIPEIETGEFDAVICGGTLLKGLVRSLAFPEMVRMVRTGEFL